MIAQSTLEDLQRMARESSLVPIQREVLADTETPVSAYLKLDPQPYRFLFESVEGGEKWGRYSFLGMDPMAVFRVEEGFVTVREGEMTRRFPHEGRPLEHLRELLSRYRPALAPGLPRFYGGAVGYLGYDMVRFMERLPAPPPAEPRFPEAVLFMPRTVLIFDRVRKSLKVLTLVSTAGAATLPALYAEGLERIEKVMRRLKAPLAPAGSASAAPPPALRANFDRKGFCAQVARARDYVLGGDVSQVVLSQRFETEAAVAPVDLYRALRFLNPSPYLFCLEMGDMGLVGSSPEVMVRLEDGMVHLRPIAGTRPRGRTEQEDRALADALLRDPKERAEHTMLVDLGRNDLGRIARPGSVQVTQLMTVERYSHVMHLVSTIQAQAAPGTDWLDVLKATFPAGTLTGAPKIRAMEIIDELEPNARGPYGGAVGYISFTGSMDLCIAIRTMVLKGQRILIQAGAGIVADSEPETEYQETLNKAEALRRALSFAAAGLSKA